MISSGVPARVTMPYHEVILNPSLKCDQETSSSDNNYCQ